MIPLLEKYCKDPVPEVAETCELALNRLRWLNSNDNDKDLQSNPYSTIDPAPPAKITDVSVLKDILLDESKSLFDRYRAMFSLRNLGTTESILALAEGNYINLGCNQLDSTNALEYLIDQRILLIDQSNSSKYL